MALEKIGAAWLKEKNGKKFLSGSLELNGRDGEKVAFLMYRTETKKNDKEPDYRLMRVVDEAPGAMPQAQSFDDDSALHVYLRDRGVREVLAAFPGRGELEDERLGATRQRALRSHRAPPRTSAAPRARPCASCS